MNNSLQINQRIVGAGQPVYVIAEISANHNHEFEQAAKIVRAAKDAGADAVKLQTYTADTITLRSDQECFVVKGGTLWDGKTLHNLYGEAFMPWEWQPKLKVIANELGMFFGALNGFFGQVLQGYKDVSRRTVITNFVGTPLMMLLSVALISAGFGLRGYITAQVMSGVVVLSLLLVFVWRLTPPAARHFRGKPSRIESQVVFFGAAVFGVGLLEFLLGQVDKVLIGAYINPREVGVYSVAMAIVAFVPVALQSVNQIFSPTIADLHGSSRSVLPN